MKLLAKRAAGPAVLLLLCVVFHWRLVLSGQYTWLDSPDIANLEVPRFQFQAREWRAGRFPLWDPTQWCGQPFLGQMTGAAYPPHWLFLWFAGRHPRISQGDLHWYLVLVRFFAALNAYLLCRYLRRSRTASIAGGLLFGLGSFVGSTDWPTVLNGILWAPLVYLFMLRAVDRRGPWLSAALSGTLLGAAWLSGHHEVPTYLSLAAVASWICLSFDGWKPDWRVVKLAAASMLFTVLASGLQVVPAVEYGRRALRWAGLEEPLAWNSPVPYLVHERFSLPLASLPKMVIPGIQLPVSPYVGVVGSLLMAMAIATRWRRPRVRLFCALALAALLFSLAGRTVLHGVLYSLAPFVEKARVPARAISVFGFAAAVVAAFGLDALRSAATAGWLSRLAGALAAAGAAIQVMRAAFPPESRAINEGFLFAGLAALAAGALLWALRRGAIGVRPAGIALLAVCFSELHYVSQTWLPSLADPHRASLWKQLRLADDLAQALRREPGLVRGDVDDREFPANFGQWHGIDTVGGAGAGVTSNIFGARQYTDRTNDLLAVTHFIGREASRKDQQEVFRGSGGLRLFRNPSAFPRTWTVHEVALAATPVEAQRMLRDPGIDLRRRAPVGAPLPALEACAGDEARVVEYQPDRVAVTASLRCTGLVVLADTWFPGWRAEVDGRPAEILEVYGALRGVVAGAGTHRIEFRYRPASVSAGAAMTAGALAGCVLLAFVEQRRRRRNPRRGSPPAAVQP
jgi:hypothetical protein